MYSVCALSEQLLSNSLACSRKGINTAGKESRVKKASLFFMYPYLDRSWLWSEIPALTILYPTFSSVVRCIVHSPPVKAVVGNHCCRIGLAVKLDNSGILPVFLSFPRRRLCEKCCLEFKSPLLCRSLNSSSGRFGLQAASSNPCFNYVYLKSMAHYCSLTKHRDLMRHELQINTQLEFSHSLLRVNDNAKQ